ncbi:uncharacterized protein [Panulirus ornatus]|uniref:uncharacterized protein isoform X1 n=1 Tax=Panulirus ornatus TaxID=150431 RepID=UPI003A8A225B
MTMEGLAKHLQDVTMLQVSTRSPVLKPGRNKADLDTSCDSSCASRIFCQHHRQSHGPDKCSSAVCGSPFTPNKNGMSSKPLKNSKVLQEVQTRSGSVLKPVSCHCYGSARLCGVCVGRSNQVAPRAGTPGFRAPEVLLRHPDQGTAVDMWSVGVILLCLLSGRYPFFRAVDDLSTLAEITTLLGTKAVRKAAAKLGKLLTCSEERNPLDLMKVCEILRNNSLKDNNTCSNVELCVGCRQQGVCVCLSPPTRSFNPSRNMGYHNKRRTHVQEFHHQKKGILPLANTCPSPIKKRNKSQISQKSPSKFFSLSSLNRIKSLETGSEKIYDKTDTQTCDRASPCSEKHCVENSSCGLHHDTFSTNFIESPAKEVTSTSTAPSGYPLLVYHLLSRLLDPNPETRITAEEALAHPFLNF